MQTATMASLSIPIGPQIPMVSSTSSPPEAGHSASITMIYTSTTSSGTRNPTPTSLNSLTQRSQSTPASNMSSGSNNSPHITLLNLPTEILETIILLLPHPLDSICLAITCRTLYHGVLSAQNRYLWYRIGNFEKQLPGYSRCWKGYTRAWKVYEEYVKKGGSEFNIIVERNVHPAFLRRQPLFPDPRSSSSTIPNIPPTSASASSHNLVGTIATTTRDIIGSTVVTTTTYSTSWLTPWQLERAQECGPPNTNHDIPMSVHGYGTPHSFEKLDKLQTKIQLLHTVVGRFCMQDSEVDYRRFLVETMLGKTESGCQWCLKQPEVTVSSLCDIMYLEKSGFEVGVKVKICKRCHKKICWPMCGNGRAVAKNTKIRWILKQQFEFLDIDHCRLLTYKDTDNACTFVWRPTVERLVRAKYGPNHAPLDTLISESLSRSPGVFKLFFKALKREYIFSESQILVELRRKLPASQLQSQWFFMPLPEGTSWQEMQAWISYSLNDIPMIALTNDENCWKKRKTWIRDMVKAKLDRMTLIFSECADADTSSSSPKPKGRYINSDILASRPWDFPLEKLVRGVVGAAVDWHVERALAGGINILLEKMNRENDGKGFICPWSSGSHHCRKLIERGAVESARDVIDHIRMHCEGLVVRGDADWLIGKPSRWWPEGLLGVEGHGAGDSSGVRTCCKLKVQRPATGHHVTPSSNIHMQGESKLAKLNALTHAHAHARRMLVKYSAALEQEKWLRKWWPERWEQGYQNTLQKWGKEGKFHEGTCIMKAARG